MRNPSYRVRMESERGFLTSVFGLSMLYPHTHVQQRERDGGREGEVHTYTISVVTIPTVEKKTSTFLQQAREADSWRRGIWGGFDHGRKVGESFSRRITSRLDIRTQLGCRL